jgi:hypothetical protein
MSIWTIVLVSACGTRARSLPACQLQFAYLKVRFNIIHFILSSSILPLTSCFILVGTVPGEEALQLKKYLTIQLLSQSCYPLSLGSKYEYSPQHPFPNIVNLCPSLEEDIRISQYTAFLFSS